VTIIKLAMLVMICIVGYANVSSTQDSPSPYNRMSPFLSPAYDVDGMFLGAASIFFAYTGFDAIGNAAEEVGPSVRACALVRGEACPPRARLLVLPEGGCSRGRSRPLIKTCRWHPHNCLQVKDVAHLPWAIVGTVGLSTGLYIMLATALVLLTYPNITCPAFLQFPCAPANWEQSAPTIGFTTAFVYAHCEFAPQLPAAPAAVLRLCCCYCLAGAVPSILDCRPRAALQA
jgi:APA family basic amino acid/polyamine antiporter